MENNPVWVRSKDGWLGGVCAGLAKHFGVEVWLMRLIWVISTVLFVPILFYFVLVFSLPREDKIEDSLRPKLLGVCLKLSKKLNIEVGLMRTLALSSLFISCGIALLVYFLVHMILISQEKQST